MALFLSTDQSDGGADHTKNQCGSDGRARSKNKFVSAKGFLEPVGRAGGAGDDGFVVEVPLQVGGHTVRRLVTPGPVLLQALHHDPVQIALEQRDKLLDLQQPA